MRSANRLVDEVRLTFQSLEASIERVHSEEGPTTAQREVMRYLRGGPATVPAIARARGVSRQHIQSMVDDLLADHLVVSRSNPAHRRSRLITLTAPGEVAIERMVARETAALRRVDAQLVGVDVDLAVASLVSLRVALDGISPSND